MEKEKKSMGNYIAQLVFNNSVEVEKKLVQKDKLAKHYSGLFGLDKIIAEKKTKEAKEQKHNENDS